MADDAETISVKKNKAPLFISLGLVGALVLAYFFVPSVNDFLQEAWRVFTSGDQQKVETWVAQFGFWAPLVVIIAMVLQMFLIVIPTPLLMIVTIVAFGPFLGSIVLLAAIFIASSVGYFIGRYFGAYISQFIGQKTANKISSFIDEYGFWTVIVVRLCPFLSNDAISFVGGILKMGYWKFIGATMLGITPLILFIAFLGENYERLKTGLVWGSIVCFVLFIVFVWWDRNRKKGSKNRKN